MDNKVVLIIVALLLPPAAVFMKKGADKDFIINLLACCLVWFPGIVHAVWLVTRDN